MKLTQSLAILVLAPITACACQFKQRTQEQVYSEATSVFRARIVEVRLIKSENALVVGRESTEIVEGKFEVEEVFKGTPPPSGIVRDFPFGPGNCSLGLLPGWEYVFVPDGQGFVLLPSQSISFLNADAPEPKAALEQFRILSKGLRP